MAHVAPTDPTLPTPSVLVVLVSHDAAAWLRDCLHALAAQTYPRLGVLAVDNASSDGSREVLEQALGAGRVLALPTNSGVAGAIQAALEVPVAREADYLLILHDDTALDPDCVTHLVEAAIGIPGVDRVGVVGPKVVDWHEPRLLREVGRSTDRFGHPYTPLQDGEIDQGQFDRVLEVLYVSSCAMLISRDCLQRVGVPDERFTSHHEDLDFCWRARLAGYRVLMTPLARARHLAASTRGDRPDEHRPRSARYYGERAALASMLKNYGLLSLLVLLPLYTVVGIGRLVWLALGRRFDDVWDLLTAWGWNVAHLPGTVRRRRKAQSVRRIRDRQIRLFMESAGGRLPRWFETAGVILAEQREIEREDEGEAPRVRLRHQTASLARAHPVLLTAFFAILFGAAAYRDLLGHETIYGAVVASFPADPSGFLRELVSGYRTTGLGGLQAGSPALAAMGGLSALLLGSTRLAQKVLLGGLPVLAAITTYRAVVRQTADRVAGAVASVAYGLSGVTMWAFSDGRIDVLVAIAALPALSDRLESAFDPEPPNRRLFVVGTGIAVATAVAFFPGVVPAIAVLTVVRIVGAPSRARGLLLTLLGVAAGAALIFPSVPDLVAGDGAALASRIGTLDVHRIGRLALGPGPGTGVTAWFLPIAALIGLSLATGDLRGRASRAAVTAVAGLGLAWAASAGYLPLPLSNPIAYIALAGSAEAMLVGYGVASLAGGVGRESFGWRQIGAAALTFVLGLGLLVQSAIGMVGGWGWGGPEAIPAAWAVVASRVEGDFNVLWVGGDDGRPFPAPGGDPQGVFAAGEDSLRFNLTGREGVTALDTARPLTGSGTTYLEGVLTELLSGSTHHAGALLGPLGVRFVVAETDDLPAGAEAALSAQLDLDPVPAEGLVIFRNAHALPPAAVTADPQAVDAARSSAAGSIEQLRGTGARPATPVEGGWDADVTGGGAVLVATQYTSGWRATSPGADLAAAPSFGWATRVEVPAGGTSSVQLRYGDQWIRTWEMWALVALWLAALWITRKRGSSR
jgi:GT2 family glycosyltransferase